MRDDFEQFDGAGRYLTQAATPGLSGNVRAVSYSPKLKIYVASNDSGKTAYRQTAMWTVNAGTLASGGTLDSIEWVYLWESSFSAGRMQR